MGPNCHEQAVTPPTTTEQEREEFLKWLSSADVEEHHLRVSDERFKDSGGWIFNTPELESWLHNGASDILWIYGKPGAGKSVIASNIIDHLVQSYPVPEIGIAFVYHDHNDVDKFGSLRRLITAMMARLCWRLATLPSDLTMLKPKHSSPTAAGTYEFFLRLAGEFKEVYLIIDALDEWSLELRQHLLHFLLSLKKEKSPIFKVLITSRPDPDIHAKLGQYITVNLSAQRDHVCDIKDVIQGKVDEFVQSGRLYLKQADLSNEIVSILTERSQGIFLWSILVLKALCEESLAYQNDDCTLQCLHELPDGLEPFYDQMIEKIKAQKSRHWNLARSTLQWICYAKSPVTATELMRALESDDAIDRFTINIKAIEAACKNLVIQQQGYLQFIHFTVQQYLKDHGIIADAALSMSTTCLHYLEGVSHAFPPTHDTHLSHIHKEFPFARHAADHWGNYTKAALQHDASGLLKAKARTLLSSTDFSASSSRLMSQPDEYYVHGRGWRENLSSLHLIAYFGLHNLLQENEYPISALEARDYEGRTPLSWAAAHGHLECVRILWSIHPDQGNFQDDNGLTALSWAAINGHENIILWLIQQEGIGIACQDSNGRTAMSHAAEFGHTSIIRILHELNPKLVNIYDSDGLSPLFWAGTNGHLDTVKLFIDELGCHPESTDRHHTRSTLLAHVAESGHTEVVNYLLKEKKVEAFRYDRDRETALSIAVQWAWKDNVEAIYHHGLENYSERFCARVCGHALCRGISPHFHQDQEEIIEILLRKGDVDYVDEDGTSALMIAALNGYENIVRLLIKRADINLRNRNLKTAWDYAKEKGHINIVRMLEAAGCDTVDFTEIYARVFPKSLPSDDSSAEV
ncbi:hypothetical protein CNMCM5793_009475 [Aspergillus hiratsukae]|uniref:NACHT domain-containing protein n=1 Tax=Aspergillus hiratsukae TaxID=1194566 RepID=A0A8H6PT82_9EURO|nr:hypothetical protein CNMCM5793_009475 [Aspergillus hiratsukae]KAF7160636.1 hypothetical protein CNMCM6106_008058 [Aspergillus hiratsukae]